MRVLVLDIGGSHVKARVTGQNEPVEIPSGRQMTPKLLMQRLRDPIAGWKYQKVTVGYPGRVQHNAIQEDAPNLGPGWMEFDFARAFERPVKILNDATMQALGSYTGGRMLFLDLGTGLGSTLILDGLVHPTELGDLPYRNGRAYADYLGKAALKRLGQARWSRHVLATIQQFKAALQVDYVVLGGGQAKLVQKLPAGVIRGDNSKAFVGGERSWKKPMV